MSFYVLRLQQFSKKSTASQLNNADISDELRKKTVHDPESAEQNLWNHVMQIPSGHPGRFRMPAFVEMITLTCLLPRQ